MLKLIVILLLILIIVIRILYLEDTENFVDNKNIKELMDMANKAYETEENTPMTFANGINFNKNTFDIKHADRDKNTLENLLANQLDVGDGTSEKLFDGYDDSVNIDTYDSQTFFDKCLEQEHLILTESMNQNMKLINLKAELERLINIEKPINELK
tara:strand:- start:2276 stop:2746 length:471 start_codon:yes stop_codon:yes gene_type:complete